MTVASAHEGPSMIRIGLAALLALLWLLIAIGNAVALGRSAFTAKFVSCVPIIGGACGVAAILMSPMESAKHWWWLPLVLDWGTVSVVIALALVPVRLVRSRRT